MVNGTWFDLEEDTGVYKAQTQEGYLKGYICEWDPAGPPKWPLPTPGGQQPPLAGKRPSHVPPDAVAFGGHWYKAVNTSGSWYQSHAASRAVGGYLAQIESAAEQRFVEQLLSGAKFDYWVDGSDAARKGQWRFADGRGISYANWSFGEPNNQFGAEGALQIRRGEAWKWNDAAADYKTAFLCEWDPAGPPKWPLPKPGGPAAPAPSPAAAVVTGQRVYLDDARETDSFVGWGSLGKHGVAIDHLGQSHRYVFRGQVRDHALTLVPPASGTAHITYTLDGNFRTLNATAALWEIRANYHASSVLTMKVIGDGRVLWTSRGLQRWGDGQDFEVDVRGVRILKLQTDCPGHNAGVYSTWINPLVSKQALPTPPAPAPPQNKPPVVDAGPPQQITLPAPANLAGKATDDNLPAGGGLRYQWSKKTGPGNVAFANPAAAATTATFSAPGAYTLELATTDGELGRSDEVTIVVNAPLPAPPAQQFPPGTVAFQGHHYLLVRIETTWHNAEKACRGLGGHLVCIESAAEDRFLAQYARGIIFFAGATDEGHEGTWTWVNGKNMVYNNWNVAAGAPDNNQGREHWLEVDTTSADGRWWWNDGAGSVLPRIYLCEWDR